MSYWRYPRYVSVAEKRAKAARKLKQLRKKNPAIQPIVLEGSAIAKTWWGKSWNLNLERYADYSNRIGRGRSYVRHGAVLDLQISAGQVNSLVQGSRSKPYAVTIKIKAITKKIWKNMKAACAGKLDSLPELLSGKFPKALGEVFTAQGRGLFPSPQEIGFDCSCPDWADMCKHVAATLYGIGTRLDDDAGLFFKLRKVKIDDLIQQTLKDQSYKLLEKAEKMGPGKIAESDLSGMFGIDMEETMDLDFSKTTEKVSGAGKKARKAAEQSRAKTAKRKPARKTPAKKQANQRSPETSAPKNRVKPAAIKARAKTSVKKATTKRKIVELTDTAQLLDIIKRSKRGLNVATLRQKTGFDEKKIRNIIYKANKEGKIRRAGRGIYLGA
ncbi:MAG: hypothetical protein JRF17_06490 [Deltaproteobacteria bacterium]|jgi:uncharacterized Zn finger protein|nr:hypothetical protein [Deltaproteobacteria bacterium]